MWFVVPITECKYLQYFFYFALHHPQTLEMEKIGDGNVAVAIWGGARNKDDM